MTDRHTQKPYPLRMPDELRAGLEASATTAGRSLNAEIVSRLLASNTDSPERALKTIEAQTKVIGMLGRYLKMTAGIAKKGNPDKLEQLLFIEAMAQTMQDGEYAAGLDLTTAMVDANKAKDASRAQGSAESADPSFKGTSESEDPSSPALAPIASERRMRHDRTKT